MQDERRIVSVDELISKNYGDMAELSVIFNHDVIEDHSNDLVRGQLRWKPNKMILLIARETPVREAEGPPWIPVYSKFSLDVSKLHDSYAQGRFSAEEMMKYYMQIGYSLCGYSEVFGNEFSLSDRNESTIEYMIRIHKGKVIRQ